MGKIPEAGLGQITLIQEILLDLIYSSHRSITAHIHITHLQSPPGVIFILPLRLAYLA